MSNGWLIVVGLLTFLIGFFGLFTYKRVHRFMFGENTPNGTPFSSGPPEFLILPMMGAIGIGGLFIFLGIDGL